MQDAQTKKAAMLAAQARVTQGRAGVLEAQANQQQVNVRAADAASADANVTLARANLETAELNLSYTTIVAPMDGVVTKKVRRGGPDCAARTGPDDDRAVERRLGDRQFQGDAASRRACRAKRPK